MRSMMISCQDHFAKECSKLKAAIAEVQKENLRLKDVVKMHQSSIPFDQKSAMLPETMERSNRTHQSEEIEKQMLAEKQKLKIDLELLMHERENLTKQLSMQQSHIQQLRQQIHNLEQNVKVWKEEEFKKACGL
eukprot:753306-Hanusia_phi.AAC.1